MSTYKKVLRIGIIGSSGGSVFREMLRLKKIIPIEFFVVTDRSCGIEEICHTEGISFIRIPEKDNEKFSKKAKDFFQKQQKNNKKPFDAILLFFTRYITEDIFNNFPTFNVHPSLLPKYKGFSPIKKAIQAQEKEIGATLHVVNGNLDEGKIIAQIKNPIIEKDEKKINTLSFLQKTWLAFWLVDELFHRQEKMRPQKNPKIGNTEIQKIFHQIERENKKHENKIDKVQKQQKTVVISQPMYFPWRGIFEQIKLADIFVHYDDVQMPQGRSFINRVQLKTPIGKIWMTVPVKKNGGKISEIKTDETKKWREEHLKKFQLNQGKAPFFKDAFELLQGTLQKKTDSLSELNISSIENCAKYLGLKTKFLRSSDVKITGKSTEKLVKISKKLKGTCYVTGHGAKNYLNKKFFEEEKIEVRIMEYDNKPYEQLWGPFDPYVSILDLIAAKGPDAVQFLTSQAIPFDN